ncbi:hypothetical protein V8C42DRAFT_305322 [Trichoderma barbatum]
MPAYKETTPARSHRPSFLPPKTLEPPLFSWNPPNAGLVSYSIDPVKKGVGATVPNTYPYDNNNTSMQLTKITHDIQIPDTFADTKTDATEFILTIGQDGLLLNGKPADIESLRNGFYLEMERVTPSRGPLTRTTKLTAAFFHAVEKDDPIRQNAKSRAITSIRDKIFDVPKWKRSSNAEAGCWQLIRLGREFLPRFFYPSDRNGLDIPKDYEFYRGGLANLFDLFRMPFSQLAILELSKDASLLQTRKRNRENQRNHRARIKAQAKLKDIDGSPHSSSDKPTGNM